MLPFRENDMGRMKEKPRYNVVSMRITDEEKKALDQVKRATRKNISDILREAMWLLQQTACNCEKAGDLGTPSNLPA